MIAFPLEAIREAGLEPMVVARGDSPLPELGVRVVREPDRGVPHPLGGVVAALQAAGGPVVVLGCDTPFVPAAVVGELARRDRTTVVRAGGRLQPLVARYQPADAAPLAGALRRGTSLTEAVASLDPFQLGDELGRHGEAELIAFNVNSPADLEVAERLLRGESG